jgi:hypothetical protein
LVKVLLIRMKMMSLGTMFVSLAGTIGGHIVRVSLVHNDGRWKSIAMSSCRS